MKTRVLLLFLIVFSTLSISLFGQFRLPTDPEEGPIGYVGPQLYQVSLSNTVIPSCSFFPGTEYTIFLDFDKEYDNGTQVNGQNCVHTAKFDKFLLKNSANGFEVISVQEIFKVDGTTLTNQVPGEYRRLKFRIRFNGTTLENELQAKIIYEASGGIFCDNDDDIYLAIPFNVGNISGSDFSLTRTQGTGTINCSGSEFYTLTNNRQDIDFGAKLTVMASFSPSNLGLTAIVSTPVGKTVKIEVKSNSTVPVGNYTLNVRVNRTSCSSGSATKSIPFSVTFDQPAAQTILSGPSTICANQNLPVQVTDDPRLFSVEYVQYATQYEWRFERTNGTLIQTRLDGIYYFPPAQGPGTYRIKVTPINGCGRGTTASQLVYYTTSACETGPGGLDPFGANPQSEQEPVTATTEDPQTLVFPNPASTELNVVVPKYIQVPATIQLVSPQGVIVVSKQTQARSNKLDVSTYPEGLYLVQVTDGNQVVSAKAFIKR